MKKPIVLRVTMGVLLCCATVAAVGWAEVYPPGDCNGDFAADVSDAVWLINYIFTGGDPPVSFRAADVNNDCSNDISDAVWIVSYVFGQGVSELQYGCQHQEIQTACEMRRYDDSGYVVIEVLGDDLRIHHFDAWYNCGLSYLVEYMFMGSTITAQEADTGEPADCWCYYEHLQSTYYDLASGEYLVVVISINGDTMAVENIVIDPEGGLQSYSQSGCLDDPYGEKQTEVEYIYDSGLLTMIHHDAFFNCAAILVVDFELAGDTLRFTETNVSDDYVYCVCYFEVTAQVAGIAAGQYVAEIYGREPMNSPPILVDRRMVVLGE